MKCRRERFSYGESTEVDPAQIDADEDYGHRAYCCPDVGEQLLRSDAGSVPGVDGVDPSPIYDGSLGAWSAGRADGGGQVVCFVMEGFRGDADGCPAEDSRADDAAESRGG